MKLCISPHGALAVVMIFCVLGGEQAAAKAAKVRVCKAPLTEIATHKTKSWARKMARIGWVQKATGAYGSAWSNLSNALVHADSCMIVAPDWQCTLTARPCQWKSNLKPSTQPKHLLDLRKPAN